MAMKRKMKRRKDEILDGFSKDLASSPEWAAETLGGASLLLYILLIIAGLCLCLGTLGVALK
jgi:hypothetical protein